MCQEQLIAFCASKEGGALVQGCQQWLNWVFWLGVFPSFFIFIPVMWGFRGIHKSSSLTNCFACMVPR